MNDEKYGFESESAREFPSIVQLAITNVCDMSCNHCPHVFFKKEPGYKPSFMDMVLYRKIVDEVAQHKGTTLRIFGWGEPLIHPHLIEMVRYAKDMGVTTVNLITNGKKLSTKMSSDLISAGLDLLEVSIDAATKGTYEAIRGKSENFDKIVSNVKNYIYLRDELLGHTYVSVSIINQPKATPEIEAFKEYWSDLADETVTRVFHDFMGYAKDKESIKLPERYPCRCLWSRFNINSEGLVSVCFNDWYNKSILGDMNDLDTSIAKIWRDKEYADFRQSHLDRKPKGVCSDCNDWIGASWETPYEKLVSKANDKILERIERKKRYNEGT